jgi:hypothetical protein
MGVELQLQAIPETCALFKRAQESPLVYGYLQFFGYYSRMPSQKLEVRIKQRQGNDPQFDEFVALMRAAWEQHPGLLERNIYLDRHWGILEWTLSSVYLDQPWVKLALYGGPPLWSMEEADTQNPLGFLPSSHVIEIATYLSAIDLFQLEKQWNPSAMREAGVYKAHHLKDSDWDWVRRELLNLQSFYALAAKHGETVISYAA